MTAVLAVACSEPDDAGVGTKCHYCNPAKEVLGYKYMCEECYQQVLLVREAEEKLARQSRKKEIGRYFVRR
jgi:hypothetical protein